MGRDTRRASSVVCLEGSLVFWVGGGGGFPSVPHDKREFFFWLLRVSLLRVTGGHRNPTLMILTWTGTFFFTFLGRDIFCIACTVTEQFFFVFTERPTIGL